MQFECYFWFDNLKTNHSNTFFVLILGHCFEQATGNPPRGLQFTLGTNSNPAVVDTIVMANLVRFIVPCYCVVLCVQFLSN